MCTRVRREQGTVSWRLNIRGHNDIGESQIIRILCSKKSIILVKAHARYGYGHALYRTVGTRITENSKDTVASAAGLKVQSITLTVKDGSWTNKEIGGSISRLICTTRTDTGSKSNVGVLKKYRVCRSGITIGGGDSRDPIIVTRNSD